MKQSKIFVPSELKALKARLKGDKKDPTGVFSGRVKPKLKEMFEWFKQKKDLEKLLKVKKK